MKHTLLVITYTLILASFVSCLDTADKKLLVGQWTGREWLVNGSPSSYVPENASFTFGDDGKYSFTYSDNTENGKYFLSNNELFTTPEGGIKMMVKVVKLTQDTLIIDMNRGGQPEKLVLVRPM